MSARDSETGFDPLLDEAVWKGLAYVESTTGPGAVSEMVEIYVADLPDRISRLRAALAWEDWPVFSRLAHDLKSNSATLGVPALRELGEALEHQSANAGEALPESLAPMLDEVERMMPQVVAALRKRCAMFCGPDAEPMQGASS